MRHIRIVMAIHKMLETKRAGHIRMLMNIRTIYTKNTNVYEAGIIP